MRGISASSLFLLAVSVVALSSCAVSSEAPADLAAEVPTRAPQAVLGLPEAQTALDRINSLSDEDRANFDCGTLPPASDFGGTYDVRAACESLKNPSAPAPSPAPDRAIVRAQAALDRVNALSPEDLASFDCAALPPASDFEGKYDVRAACAQLKAASGSGAAQ